MNKKKIQRKKIFLKITINVLILAIAALGLMALLTWLQFIGDWGKVTSFITDRTKIFYYTALLIFLWLLFLVGLTGRVNQAVGISFFLLIVITYINKCKFRLRGTPLLPEDFQLAGETESLTDFIDYSELFKVILAVVLLVVLTVIIGKIMRTVFVPDTSDEKWLCMDFSGQEPKMLVNLVLMLDKLFCTTNPAF